MQKRTGSCNRKIPKKHQGRNWLDQAQHRKTALRRSMLAWFRKRSRDLPWRRSKDPYRIWVSEIMLQQTRIDTVIPYFQRFIKAFPTVQRLANAGEDEILKQWEGLGYYTRAVNLHKAAQLITREYGGRFPRTVKEWLCLPGVGPYTAGAVVSIAFDTPAPVLDGNVKRTLCRLFKIEERIDKAETLRKLWTAAEELVSPSHPGDFNQAMMELGARICTPKRPLCDQCPVRRMCDAHASSCAEKLPVRQRKKRVPHYEIVAAVIRKNGRFLLGKRPPGAMLGGLWEFPGGKVETGETHQQAIERELEEELGIEVRIGSHIATVQHAYSHFRITLHVYVCQHVAGKPEAKYHSQLKWVLRSHLDRYPLPAADLKFLDRLCED